MPVYLIAVYVIGLNSILIRKQFFSLAFVYFISFLNINPSIK